MMDRTLYVQTACTLWDSRLEKGFASERGMLALCEGLRSEARNWSQALCWKQIGDAADEACVATGDLIFTHNPADGKKASALCLVKQEEGAGEDEGEGERQSESESEDARRRKRTGKSKAMAVSRLTL